MLYAFRECGFTQKVYNYYKQFLLKWLRKISSRPIKNPVIIIVLIIVKK